MTDGTNSIAYTKAVDSFSQLTTSVFDEATLGPLPAGFETYPNVEEVTQQQVDDYNAALTEFNDCVGIT